MEWLVVCLLGVMRTVWLVFLLGSALVEIGANGRRDGTDRSAKVKLELH